MNLVRSIRSRWRSILGKRASARGTATAEYYQQLHDSSVKYQENNWMLDQWELIKLQPARTLVEVGCGNGRFLDLAAGHFTELHGCDWAISPRMRETLARRPNVRFHKLDVTSEQIPLRAELVVTSDVLEHFPPACLDFALKNIDSVAPRVLHKIACYDDGHSHLSIFGPHEWLARLQAIDSAYCIIQTQSRRPDRPIVTIGKNLQREP
jgi:SAM-dependent methyltransferase